MISIWVHIPEDAVDTVATAMFSAGAGRVGAYDQACFLTKGVGRFRPLAGANPHIGKVGELTEVAEVRLETVCSEEDLPAVVAAMKKAHPYEEPSWHACRSLIV